MSLSGISITFTRVKHPRAVGGRSAACGGPQLVSIWLPRAPRSVVSSHASQAPALRGKNVLWQRPAEAWSPAGAAGFSRMQRWGWRRWRGGVEVGREGGGGGVGDTRPLPPTCGSSRSHSLIPLGFPTSRWMTIGSRDPGGRRPPKRRERPSEIQTHTHTHSYKWTAMERKEKSTKKEDKPEWERDACMEIRRHDYSSSAIKKERLFFGLSGWLMRGRKSTQMLLFSLTSRPDLCR